MNSTSITKWCLLVLAAFQLLVGVALAQAPQDGGAAPAPRDSSAATLFAEPNERDLRAAKLFDAGVAAWREGRHARAGELWHEALDVLGPPSDAPIADEVVLDRHALLFDLGNAAFRAERPLEAVGWYTAAARYAPRDRDTRHNLALARERAGLAPVPGPGLAAHAAHYLAALTPGESRWLALAGLVPLVVALLVEALRGGRKQALAAVLALLLAAVAGAPLVAHRLAEDREEFMVVRAGGVDLMSEARADASHLAAAAAGETVVVLDTLPDWMFVTQASGARGWVPRSDLFELRR